MYTVGGVGELGRGNPEGNGAGSVQEAGKEKREESRIAKAVGGKK